MGFVNAEIVTMDEDESEQGMTYLDLAWEDILFVYVLPRLSWTDIFRLRRVSWENWKLVNSYLSQLKFIEFSDANSKFTDAAFQIVTENCSNLRKITLSDASWATDLSLTRVFKSNKQLISLELSACTRLNGSCLLALVVNCKKLDSLILRQSPWMSRGAVDTVIAHLRFLRHVDFSSCASLTNTQLIPFCQAFPRLVQIRLAYIQAVNDSTLTIIARACRDLEHLDIRSCMCVTDHGIRAISDYSTKLKILEVANCHLVTEYSLNTFRLRGTVSVDRPITNLIMDLPLIHMPGVQV